MKEPYNNKVNYYTNLSSTEPISITLTEIQKQTRRGWGYADTINKLRSLKDRTQINKLKSTLPVVTFNANFSPTKSVKDFLSHNGLLIADLDGFKTKEELLNEVERLKADKYTLMLFLSPSGKGIKVLIKIPKTTPKGHEEYFKLYQDHIKSKYWDSTSKNVNRLCFISYDKNSYINQDSEIFKKQKQVDDYFLHKLNKDCDYFSYLTYEKHYAINKLAYTWGGLQAGNDTNLTDDFVIEVLNTAIDNNTSIIDYDAAKKTVLIAFDAGKINPLKKEKHLQSIKEEEVKKDVKFPVGVFPSNLQLMMFEYEKTLNYNIDFMAISIMFTVGTLCGNKYKVKVKNGWITPPLFWFVALGLPGTIKTHPLKTLIKPLEYIDELNKDRYDKEMKEYELLDDKNKPIKPIFKQSIVKDTTLEALHYVHSNNIKGLGLYKDELNGFFNDMNKYRKGSDVEFWLESFNNNSYIINRVTKEPKLIKDTFVNIIGTIQPDVLKETLNASENGMVDRFLYTKANEDIKDETLNEMDQKIINWYNDIIYNFYDKIIYKNNTNVILLSLSKEVSMIRINYSNSLNTIMKSDNETQQLKNYVSKIKTYLPRFALVISLINHIFDGDNLSISEDNMKKAILLCDYFIHSANVLFEENEKENEIIEQKESMRGMSKKDKIINLHKNGESNASIAKSLKVSRQYVSKVLLDVNKNN